MRNLRSTVEEAEKIALKEVNGVVESIELEEEQAGKYMMWT